MNKRKTKNWWDTTFWYIIYMLPIIITLLACLNAMGNDGFYAWFEYDGDLTNFPAVNFLSALLNRFGFYGESFIGNAFRAIFDKSTGYFPVIDDFYSITYAFVEYFITMVVVHLMVDFVLFIPRFAHKLMDKCYQDD